MNEFNAAGSKSITVLGDEQLDNVVGGWGRHYKHGGNKRHGGYGMQHQRRGDGDGRRGEGRRGEGRPIIVVVIDARTIVNVVNNVV